MPSRSATKAALRRSQEPSVIPPVGLAEMPFLGGSIVKDRGWRNPLRGDHFDRSLWEAYKIRADSAPALATVRLLDDGTFEVSSTEAFAKVTDTQAAFELAAGWAMAAMADLR